MDIRKLQRAIVDGLEDVKAQNIVVFNTEHLSPLFERVIVASGTSNRQTRALASSVRETVKARGLPVLSVEGADNGEWIVVDCGAAVAHIMQPAIRDYYRLEEIWGGQWVRSAFDDYAKRMPPECRLELVEVKAEPRDSGKSAPQMLAAEAQRLRAACSKAALVVVLDEQGRRQSTAQLAERLQSWRESGR